jgi:hypothetical protein
MSSKGDWTDAIASSTICNYFYIFFVVYSVFAAISLIGGIGIFATTKMSGGQLFGMIFNIILSFGLAATSALFFYLMCERALKPAMESQQARSKASSEYGM